MRTSNPIFSRWGAARAARPAGGYPPRQPAAPLGDRPAGGGLGVATVPDLGTAVDARATRATMTMDDVVVHTAATVGTAALAAVLSWLLLPVDEANLGRSYGIAVSAALVAFVLSLVQSFRRTPVPALILGYAALEGVFLGVLSSAISTYVAPGVVEQAVLGTFAVAGGVLLAYRRGWIRVTRTFAGFVGAAATGFVLLLVADSLFSAFGAGNGLGFHGGGLGAAFAIVGVLLGAAFLALDFRQVEDAVASGAPREQAWLAAFGLTMTLVWIYLEVLRVVTIFTSND
ncbi:Uncharacterized membrane protein, YccA/Bax inhibitor family [Actinacidiphila yanglinensis]|uniref:Uncharacterized membrane protein, YccA/Bax inhibitor family n=1 Tax=Actinacidiphila yanglinensis TaxID=310779 RepID=A0A1H6E4F2_9ACTN|nr:Bax inhibitor-1/YccA family protein [Actinacidiphila yanglinensis]SEG92113.1 Uncharacterized membrane protein, YccA/Bax inhibitor family [Actinacidiphila yanglinensis]